MILFASLALAVAAPTIWDPRLSPLGNAQVVEVLDQDALRCGSLDLLGRREVLLNRYRNVRRKIEAKFASSEVARNSPPMVVATEVGRVVNAACHAVILSTR